MQDFFAVPDERLKQTARALRRILKERGWQDAKIIPTAKHLLIFATRPDGKKIRFCSCIPNESSSFACAIANDKIASYEVLKTIGAPQPDTMLLSDNEEERRGQLESFLERYGKIVIKPVDGAHGRNVETDITNIDDALVAAKACEKDDVKQNALVQEQLERGQIEKRVICIGYKYIATYERIPAQVTGDGEHTIMELIALENRDLRGEAYSGKPAKIDASKAEEFLKIEGIDSGQVPAAGEKVRVLATCNSGMGGTIEESDITPEQIELSEKIARVAELPVIGIDFYGDKIVEINAGPGLYHLTGDEESANKCVEAYADYLENI